MKKWVVFGRLPRSVRVAAVCETEMEAAAFIGSDYVPELYIDYVIPATGETVVIF